jgi:hypothetical protein
VPNVDLRHPNTEKAVPELTNDPSCCYLAIHWDKLFVLTVFRRDALPERDCSARGTDRNRDRMHEQ